MEILLDSGNLSKIKKAMAYYTIDGITTNPSILVKEADDLQKLLMDLKNLIGNKYKLHVQTSAKTCENMVAQGEKLKAFFGEKFYLKIPITPEGLKAVEICKSKGIKVTITAVFTPMQVLLAAKAGADYVAPYINRMENIGVDSEACLKNMLDILRNYGYSTKILGASFKNVLQVQKVAIQGIHGVTVTSDLLSHCLKHPYTDKSLEDFEADWEKRFKEKEITDFLAK